MVPSLPNFVVFARLTTQKRLSTRQMANFLDRSSATDAQSLPKLVVQVDDNGVPATLLRRGPHVAADKASVSELLRVMDSDLIQRCQAGDREAQRQLFERTSLSIYRLLLRMTGNAEDAAELTQDTYVKGLRRLNQFDGRCAISTWFYRIAINEALQFRRRRNLASLKLRRLASDQMDRVSFPDSDLRLDLDDALLELPTDDRAILLLRYQENLDYRTIAEVLDCAEGTVASRLNRARERLRDFLYKSYG